MNPIPITHYSLEFHPGNSYMRICISTSGINLPIRWTQVPVTTLETFTALCSMLSAGNCAIAQNGTIVLLR